MRSLYGIWRMHDTRPLIWFSGVIWCRHFRMTFVMQNQGERRRHTTWESSTSLKSTILHYLIRILTVPWKLLVPPFHSAWAPCSPPRLDVDAEKRDGDRDQMVTLSIRMEQQQQFPSLIYMVIQNIVLQYRMWCAHFTGTLGLLEEHAWVTLEGEQRELRG
jgi:hypothetical protein